MLQHRDRVRQRHRLIHVYEVVDLDIRPGTRDL